MRAHGKQSTLFAAILIVALGCSKQEVKQTEAQTQSATTTRAANADDAAVPMGQRDDPAAREQQRLDEQWRQLESLREAKAGAAAACQRPPR